MLTAALPAVQMPLIHIVESNDLHLERQEEILWFNLLRNFHRPPAACGTGTITAVSASLRVGGGGCCGRR